MLMKHGKHLHLYSEEGDNECSLSGHLLQQLELANILHERGANVATIGCIVRNDLHHIFLSDLHHT